MYSGGDHTKAAAYIVENLLDPATAMSEEPNEAALQRGFGTTLSYFEWMDQPEHAAYRKKFGIAMGATTNYSEDALITKGDFSLPLSSACKAQTSDR